MHKYSNQDHYLDPETGVLKNRLGIRDEDTLEKAEATFVSLRSYELSQQPISGRFNLEHLKQLHFYLFQDIYEWAGKLRTIDISKGESHFAHYRHLETSANTLFNKIHQENCLQGLELEQFSIRLAYYFGEINVLHPFREGNGRVQREFITQLVRYNGYGIDWSIITPEQMLEASIQSFKGKQEGLKSLIQSALYKS